MNQLTVGMKGFFTLEKFKGEYVYDIEGEHVTGYEGRNLVWVYGGKKELLCQDAPNLILDSGRDGMANNAVFHGQGAWAQVGFGQTQPTAEDTALEFFAAATNTIAPGIGDNVFGAQAAPPYYGWRRTTYRFAEGAAAGDLNEGGVGWGSSGSTIICRHRLVNLVGTQVTITVLPTEWLDLTYELRYYPPTVDVAQTPVNVDGIDYDVLTRASRVNGASEWGERIGLMAGEFSAAVSDWLAYDGDIGDILNTPIGNQANCDNFDQQNQTYNNGFYTRIVFSNTGATGWNLGAGIRSIRIKTNMGEFQSQFNATVGDATIPKDNTESMQMKWQIGWVEEPIP